MEKRLIQSILYEQVARIGKAVANPKRLELLNLLAQGEKTVETLAHALAIDIKLTSAHLRTLKEAHLVTTRRDGKYIIYALSGTDISPLLVNLREVAEKHLLELKEALNHMIATPEQLTPHNRDTLLAKVTQGEAIIIDVRPFDEYKQAHLPFARSIPLDELEKRITELPLDKEIIAYCRGPFCLLSDEAITLLAAKGFNIKKLSEGVTEWLAAGLPLQQERS